MKKFEVLATNTMKLKITIEAENLEAAQAIVDELIVDDFEPESAVFNLDEIEEVSELA
jgi:hypothetical protein